MNRLTTIGIILAVLGVIAHFVDCPYGVHCIIAGAIIAVIGLFTRAPRNTPTSV